VFDITTESRQGGVEVIATGELDLATRDRLRDAVAASLRGPGPVTLDLQAITFIDSTGLQALLELVTLARDGAPGGPLAILASDEVRRVLALTGLDRHLAVDDRPAAGSGS
jgi:anti-sigma B factor antagonist